MTTVLKDHGRTDLLNELNQVRMVPFYHNRLALILLPQVWLPNKGKTEDIWEHEWNKVCSTAPETLEVLIVLRCLAWYLPKHSPTEMLVIIEQNSRIRCNKTASSFPVSITLTFIHPVTGCCLPSSYPGPLEGPPQTYSPLRGLHPDAMVIDSSDL